MARKTWGVGPALNCAPSEKFLPSALSMQIGRFAIGPYIGRLLGERWKKLRINVNSRYDGISANGIVIDSGAGVDVGWKLQCSAQTLGHCPAHQVQTAIQTQ
jgi:hypothetical protein